MDEKRYEEIQLKYCSNSRAGKSEKPGRMGRRLERNILEALPYFAKYKDTPILDIGAGDGLGMSEWRNLGFKTAGIEVSADRVDTGKMFGLDLIKGVAEDLSSKADRSHNIFCSHTLEHCRDQKKAIQEIQRVARSIVWILVPVEPKGSRNAAHFSPVLNLDQIARLFPSSEWTEIRHEYRFNLESEGLLAFNRV